VSSAIAPSQPRGKPSATEELQAKPYTPYGACRKVWESRAFEILVAGPAGTGKTRSDLEKIVLACMKYPKCRALIVRKTRAELTETALPELEDHVFAPNWRTWGGKAKRQQRSAYHFPNDSIIVVGGMDDPMKVLSSEWDRILVVEAVQLTEEDYEYLTSRCRATHTPFNQIICETNPNVPAHWLLRRAKAGKMEFYTSTHRDNPKWVDQKTGEYTPAGKHYIEVVLGNMTGTRRRRLLDGIWCGDEAAVFDMDVLERHLHLCREPTFRLRITHTLDGAKRDESIKQQRYEDVICTRQPAAETSNDWQNHLLWWGDLIKDPKTGQLRPPQDRTYVLSADISGGNEASNSIIAIADRNTRTKVGEWVSATISPGGLARMMAMLGLWCGGARKVGHLIWEANYPGPHFGRQLSRVLEYPSLYRREQGAAKTFGTTTQELGWFNSQTSLRDGVEALRDAYARDEYHNPSEQAIQEAMQWLRFPTGKLGPGHLQEESADARQTHGDRVIADLLLVIGMHIDLPTIKDARSPTGFWSPERIQALEDTGPSEDFEDDGEVVY